MTRLKNDQYFTPPGLIYPIFREMRFNADDIYFEPCAGDGAIAKELACEMYEENILTADIDPELKGLNYRCFDATDSQQWREAFRKLPLDWVITNPPYKQPDCDKIIRNAWKYAGEGIAMLLRLTYLEPCQNRAQFLKDAYLSNLIVFNPRPQFIPGKKATDSSTVAWFVWRKDSSLSRLQTKITFCTDWNED